MKSSFTFDILFCGDGGEEWTATFCLTCVVKLYKMCRNDFVKLLINYTHTKGKKLDDKIFKNAKLYAKYHSKTKSERLVSVISNQ